MTVKYYNQPADKMHLISTEDVQYQPLVSIWELHVLGEDGSCEHLLISHELICPYMKEDGLHLDRK